jgi:hypothetical protein
MTPQIKNCVERATHYRNEVLKEISKHQTADTSDRSVVATAFVRMAASDFMGIISEIASNNPTPAFKLFRLLYEDVVNGLWAQAFGSDDLIAELLHGTDGQFAGTHGTAGRETGYDFRSSSHCWCSRHFVRGPSEQILEHVKQLHARRFDGNQSRTCWIRRRIHVRNAP